jgi:hypothetical protein
MRVAAPPLAVEVPAGVAAAIGRLVPMILGPN